MPQRRKSGKERQEDYINKIRSNPAAYDEYKRKERERWNRRKDTRKPKSDRSIRKQRKKWREAQRCRREKQRSCRKADFLNTPPCTPDPDGELPAVVPPLLSISRQQQSGRKRMRKDRTAAYREIHRLKAQLLKERQRCERYRKRAQRAKTLHLTQVLDTPRSKTRAMLGTDRVNPSVRRNLLLHNVLCHSIRDKYRKTNSDKERQILSCVVTSRLLKKYRVINSCRDNTGISKRRLSRNVTDHVLVTQYKRKSYASKAPRLRNTVTLFLERDDNSRITTSKSDTMSRHGIKKQRRLLTDTMTRLHAKFCLERPDVKVSRSTFCSLRPFWIVQPTARDRETCLCKLHENGNLVISKLCQQHLLPDGCVRAEICVERAVCSKPAVDCYTRQCSHCVNNLSLYLDEVTAKEPIQWSQWETVQEARVIKGKSVTVKRTIRVDHHGTVEDLVALFKQLLIKLCWHILVIKNQFRQYHRLKDNCSSDTCIIVIDYSENYGCKQSRAVQSAHFGASNAQVSLHTGVAYMRSAVMSFCSISDCTRHDAAAIWACILPVLRCIRQRNPAVEHLHFWSDGPVTQYKNRNNLFLASQLTFHEGFSGSSWNYFEAGHDKGPADAIGGVVKRAADRAVDHGTDIVNASNLYDVLKQKTSVELFLVSEDEVTAIDSLLLKELQPVVGIMKVHQLQMLEPWKVSIRNLSCFCAAPSACDCHASRAVNFPAIERCCSTLAPTVLQPQLLLSLVEDVQQSAELTSSTSVTGRPNKGASRSRSSHQSTSVVQDAYQLSETTSSGKRRGRPKKGTSTGSGNQSAKAISSSTRRGRPRKVTSRGSGPMLIASRPRNADQRPPLPRQPTWLSEKTHHHQG